MSSKKRVSYFFHPEVVSDHKRECGGVFYSFPKEEEGGRVPVPSLMKYTIRVGGLVDWLVWQFCKLI